MKKLIFTFVFAGFLLYVSAQYNTELIDTTKRWSTADTYTAGGGIMYSFFNKFGDDTIINNQSYTKIYRAFDEFMTEWELQGFIRKVDQKYYLRNLANEVGLAYDFDVNIGDNLYIDNPFTFYPFEANVVDIDSVFIEPANQYRKRIKLLGPYPYPYYTEYWIEGMGSTAGLIHSGCIMSQLTGSAMFTLLCYYEDDELIYKNPNFPVCFYPIVGTPKPEKLESYFSLNPNPVTDASYLTIRYDKAKYIKIHIFNSLGEQVSENKIQAPGSLNINASDYSKGVYFYTVSKGNQVLFRDKFIIQ